MIRFERASDDDAPVLTFISSMQPRRREVLLFLNSALSSMEGTWWWRMSALERNGIKAILGGSCLPLGAPARDEDQWRGPADGCHQLTAWQKKRARRCGGHLMAGAWSWPRFQPPTEIPRKMRNVTSRPASHTDGRSTRKDTPHQEGARSQETRIVTSTSGSSAGHLRGRRRTAPRDGLSRAMTPRRRSR